MICTWKRAFQEFEGSEFMLSQSSLNLVFTYWKDLAPWFVPGKRALKHLEGLDSGVQAVSWCALDKWVGEVKRGKQDISAGARHYTSPHSNFMGIINPMARAVLHTYFTKKNTHSCFGGAQPKKKQYLCDVPRSKIQTRHHLGPTTTYQ